MLLTVLFPGLSLILHKRPGLGAVLVVFQLTLIGWPLGTLLAARHLQRERRRHRRSGYWPHVSVVQRLLY